jgi:hypothetical protein
VDHVASQFASTVVVAGFASSGANALDGRDTNSIFDDAHCILYAASIVT